MIFSPLESPPSFPETPFVPQYVEAVARTVSDYFIRLNQRSQKLENTPYSLHDIKNFEVAISGLIQILETIKSWERELVANLRSAKKTDAEEQHDYELLESTETLYKNWLNSDRMAQLLFSHFAKFNQPLRHFPEYKNACDYVQRRLEQFDADRMNYEELSPAAAADARKILGI